MEYGANFLFGIVWNMGQTSCLVEKPIIMFVQDEAIFKSYDGAKKFWKQTAKQKIRKKGEGVGIMACAFVSAQVGYTSDNYIYMLHTHTHMCVYHDRQ